MKVKDLVHLPPITKIDRSRKLSPAKKMEIMARNKAIKEIGEIEVDMEEQKDLVEILVKLEPLGVIKG